MEWNTVDRLIVGCKIQWDLHYKIFCLIFFLILRLTELLILHITSFVRKCSTNVLGRYLEETYIKRCWFYVIVPVGTMSFASDVYFNKMSYHMIDRHRSNWNYSVKSTSFYILSITLWSYVLMIVWGIYVLCFYLYSVTAWWLFLNALFSIWKLNCPIQTQYLNAFGLNESRRYFTDKFKDNLSALFVCTEFVKKIVCIKSPMWSIA